MAKTKRAHPMPADIDKTSKLMMYFFAFATPLFIVPQAVEIYRNQAAENVSIYTWVFFLFADAAWIWYALKFRLKPLFFSYCLYFLVESTVVAGILLYS